MTKLEEVKLIKDNYLDTHLKSRVEKRTSIELQIKLSEGLDPNEKMAEKPLKYDSQGRVMSKEKITRGEYIEILKKELEEVNREIQTIIESY